MLVTHHALSRLVQRSSVKRIEDLHNAVCNIWSAYTERVSEYGPEFQDDHRLTFRLDGGGNALAVLNHHRSMSDAGNSVVVSTIL
jgi:hypothetical protein